MASQLSQASSSRPLWCQLSDYYHAHAHLQLWGVRQQHGHDFNAHGRLPLHLAAALVMEVPASAALASAVLVGGSTDRLSGSRQQSSRSLTAGPTTPPGTAASTATQDEHGRRVRLAASRKSALAGTRISSRTPSRSHTCPRWMITDTAASAPATLGYRDQAAPVRCPYQQCATARPQPVQQIKLVGVVQSTGWASGTGPGSGTAPARLPSSAHSAAAYQKGGSEDRRPALLALQLVVWWSMVVNALHGDRRCGWPVCIRYHLTRRAGSYGDRPFGRRCQ